MKTCVVLAFLAAVFSLGPVVARGEEPTTGGSALKQRKVLEQSQPEASQPVAPTKLTFDCPTTALFRRKYFAPHPPAGWSVDEKQNNNITLPLHGIRVDDNSVLECIYRACTCPTDPAEYGWLRRNIPAGYTCSEDTEKPERFVCIKKVPPSGHRRPRPR